MSFHMAQHDGSRALRVSSYLQHIDYQIANDNFERDRIFRLRYQAYLGEGAIEANPEARFADRYDSLGNCRIFGLYLDDWLVSSIRFHVIDAETPFGPALDVFPDIVQPMLDQGLTVIDPSRFVIDQLAARDFPDLPFLTLRVACMASEYFAADYCLATVRKEHCAFYRRVFNSELVCEPRPYPKLKQPICLMRADVRTHRDELAIRYPVFVSTLTERRLIFDNSGSKAPALLTGSVGAEAASVG